MTDSIEQYRAGFEAWALQRAPGHSVAYRANGEYVDYATQCAWVAWVAAKREDSTEPSAEQLAWESTTPVYTRFITDTRYKMLRPEARKWYRPVCQKCEQASTEQQKDEATDAARYRWLRNEGCNFVWAEIGAGNFRSGLDEAIDDRMARDAAIAHTKAQEGK